MKLQNIEPRSDVRHSESNEVVEPSRAGQSAAAATWPLETYTQLQTMGWDGEEEGRSGEILNIEVARYHILQPDNRWQTGGNWRSTRRYWKNLISFIK